MTMLTIRIAFVAPCLSLVGDACKSKCLLAGSSERNEVNAAVIVKIPELGYLYRLCHHGKSSSGYQSGGFVGHKLLLEMTASVPHGHIRLRTHLHNSPHFALLDCSFDSDPLGEGERVVVLVGHVQQERPLGPPCCLSCPYVPSSLPSPITFVSQLLAF